MRILFDNGYQLRVVAPVTALLIIGVAYALHVLVENQRCCLASESDVPGSWPTLKGEKRTGIERSSAAARHMSMLQPFFSTLRYTSSVCLAHSFQL